MMDFSIRSCSQTDLEDVVQLSLAAWEPVFRSFEQIMGASIYGHIYPDWQRQQREVVEHVCQDARISVWVAEVEGAIAGFIAYILNSGENKAENTGELELLAVHPAYQNRGIGTALNQFALQKMKESGMKIAVVATGGDPSHAPARRTYEKAGYTALPLVRYYQDL